jgi:PAS domain S-box-containing protein
LFDNLLSIDIYEQAKKNINLYDIYLDTPQGKKSEMLLAWPVYDFNNVFLGIIVFELDMNVVYKHIEDRTGLGKTGELVLGKKVNGEVLYLNSLKYEPNAALNKKIIIGSKEGVPIQNAVMRRIGNGISYDYRGKEVLAAWKNIPSLNWGIVAKIDADEALSEIADLQNILLVIIVGVFGVAVLISISVAHSITKPLRKLSKGVQEVGAGNLNINLSSNLNDEIGDLSRAFDKMTRNLKITTASRDELNNEIFERKRIEETLRKSELRYRELVQNANSAIIRWNRHGAITFFNEYAQNFFGYKLDEILGKSVTILVPKQESTGVDLSGLVDDIVIHPENFSNHVNENICKDGRRVWMAWTNKPVFDENGRVSEIFAVGTDITDRKNAEIQLKQAHDELEQRVKERTLDLDQTIDALQQEVELRTKAEKTAQTERRRLHDVLEMLPAYAILLTPDYHVVYANKFFEQRFGKHEGKKCYEFLFNRCDACENCKTYNVFKTNKPQFWEWVGPDGKNYDIYDYPFQDSDGSPLIMEIGVDVTSHKQLQKSLHSSSLYARGLLEASVDPLVTISHTGKITDVNKATEDVTGFPRQILIGRDFSDYFTQPQKAKQGYEKVLSEGQLRDYPLSIRHKSGKITDVMYNATVYRNEAGEVQGVFAAARDITRTKAAEAELDKYRKNLEQMVAQRTKELERSNKDLEQFAYVASHDLQEPLRAVAGFIEILKMQLNGILDINNLKYMNFAVDGVMRMQALIQGLLKYSRAGTGSTEPQLVDARKVVDRSLSYLEHPIAESGAEISIGDLPTVRIDESQFVQLFQNLIANAIKFRSDKKPHINITAEKNDGFWRFAVSDNGIGLEQEYAERIFLIFQRLHARDKYPGTGIGLSICKKIVERNGGKIWVESQPGKGSTFYFTLPEIG